MASGTLTDKNIDRIIKQNKEPEWLASERKKAWDIFSSVPYPTRADEAWRQSEISDIDFTGLDSFIDKLPIKGETEHRYTGKTRGVIATSLADAVRRFPELVQPCANRMPYDIADQKFTAMTRALWTEGAFVYVPANTNVSVAVNLRTIAAKSYIFPRIIIKVEANSSVTILDEYLSSKTDSQVISSGTTEIYLAEGATVRYVHINQFGNQVNHFHRQYAELGKDSNFKSLTIGLGGKRTKSTIEAVLSEPGALSELMGVVFGSGKQRFDHHTIQHHAVGNTKSDLLFRTAVDDKSVSVYTGLIRIDKDAQQTNAYQSNANLILNKQAQIFTIPNLEIEANDVRCSHGATTAPIDENHLFYLQSRGIALDDAKRLIIEGWFEPVLDKAELSTAKDTIRNLIAEKIRK